jgi:hypothetical protein
MRSDCALRRRRALIKSAAMPRLTGLFALLWLTACAGGGPTPVPGDTVQARFTPGGNVNQIEVTAIDRQPMRGAELVAPDGHKTAALSVAANPASTQNFSAEFPQIPTSGPNYGVSSIGSNALAPGVVGTAPLSQTRLLAIVSNATIQLPDPAAYQRDWRQYRIRLRFGDPPQVETREIAAPAPPSAG